MSQPLAKSKRTGAFDIETAPRSIVLLGRVVALVGCLVAPWMFGCFRFREAKWLYVCLSLALLLAAIAVLIRCIRSPLSGSLRVPLLLVPMFAWVALGAIQLLPVPQTLTDSTVQQVPALRDIDFGDGIKSRTMSFHPTATGLEIGRYSYAIAAFLIGYTLFRTPGSQRWLWGAMLLNGVALVAFGIIQKSTWNGKLFWSVPLRFGGDPFSSFVNRNNAVAFLHLAGASGVGLMVWALERKPIRATRGLFQAFVARLAAIDAMQVLLLLGLALLGGGAVASTSRGGTLSFAVAAFVVLVFLAGARKAVWPLVLAIIAVAVSAGVVYSLQMDEELRARISKLDPEKIETRYRVLHAKDALQLVERLPWTGSGLGTHGYSTRPFVSDLGRRWAVHADNQYVEVAVEAGVTGLLIVLILLAVIARLFWVGRSGFPEVSGTAAALLFLLCSHAVHAMFDYGIILPATLCGAALLTGTGCGGDFSPDRRARGQRLGWASRSASSDVGGLWLGRLRVHDDRKRGSA